MFIMAHLIIYYLRYILWYQLVCMVQIYYLDAKYLP